MSALIATASPGTMGRRPGPAASVPRSGPPPRRPRAGTSSAAASAASCAEPPPRIQIPKT